MSEQQGTNEAAGGRSDSTPVLDTLQAENERLRAEFGRECMDADEIFAAIGWGVERTRTEGGSLRVASLKNALRHMIAPGDGG